MPSAADVAQLVRRRDLLAHRLNLLLELLRLLLRLLEFDFCIVHFTFARVLGSRKLLRYFIIFPLQRSTQVFEFVLRFAVQICNIGFQSRYCLFQPAILLRYQE